MTKYLGTLFNSGYLGRGTVLIESLYKQYTGKFHLFVLCLDKETREYIEALGYQHVEPIFIGELESFYPELIKAKSNRKLVEYYFTLSPVFPLYILTKYKVSQVTTMDADLCFFSDPSGLFEEIEKHSISITPHNFSDGLGYKEIYGRYNVSFQSFKNNGEGVECLERWKEQCIEWCYDTPEENRFADQKYLDEWPFKYQQVYEIDISGAGIAPWNLERFIKALEGEKNNLKGELIFYHFHQLRFVGSKLFDLGLDDYSVQVNKLILYKIYRPYIKKLLQFQHNHDGQIQRNATSQISLKQALLNKNSYVLYLYGLMLRTMTFQPFMSSLRRIYRVFFRRT